MTSLPTAQAVQSAHQKVSTSDYGECLLAWALMGLYCLSAAYTPTCPFLSCFQAGTALLNQTASFEYKRADPVVGLLMTSIRSVHTVQLRGSFLAALLPHGILTLLKRNTNEPLRFDEMNSFINFVAVYAKVTFNPMVLVTRSPAHDILLSECVRRCFTSRNVLFIHSVVSKVLLRSRLVRQSLFSHQHRERTSPLRQRN